MKANIILGLLVIGLMANGSSCLNDPFIVPLNATLQYCDASNPGGAWGPPDDQPETVRILDKIPESYRDDVVGARLIDVVVYAVDPDTNAFVSGEAGIIYQGQEHRVISFQGSGKYFSERRSLLEAYDTPSNQLVPDPAGVTLLESIIQQFLLDPENTYITVYSKGTVTPAIPSPGQTVCAEVIVQVDGQVNVE